ncbi:MAG: hypothetical protein KIS86_14960 [Devosia sp.]|nr:hypothetical protein [Devosia sp.]
MKFFNRVHVATATVGTGSLALGAAVATNMLTLAEAGAQTGDETTFVIEQGSDIEICRGFVGSSGATVTRAVVLRSKIAGVAGTAKINLNGSAKVRFFPSAETLTEVANRVAVDIAFDNASSGAAAANVQAAIDELFGKANSLATVATTGNYNDLSDQPDVVGIAMIFGD